MRIHNQILLLLLSLCLIQCGALFAPKKQTITLETSNSESKIYLDDKEFGQGYSVTDVLRKDKPITSHQIKLETPGYKTSYQVLKPKGRYPMFWPLQAPHALLFGIPTLLDLGMVAPFRFEKNTRLESPLEIVSRDNNQKHIELYGVYIDWKSMDTNYKYIWTKRSKSVKEAILKAEEKYDRKSKSDVLGYIDPEKINEKIYEYLYDNNFMDTVFKVFSDEHNTFKLEGKITGFTHYNLKSKGYGPHEKGKVNMVWYLRNTYGERIDSMVQSSFSGEFINATNAVMLQDAVENSYLTAMSSDQFQEAIMLQNNFDFTQESLSIPIPGNFVKNTTDAGQATVVLKSENGHGSGFAISNDGYILTNYHVISDGEYGPTDKISIIRPDGSESKVSIVRFNKYKDVALLRADTTFEKAFRVGNTKTYNLYQDIYTIGAPKSIELAQSYNYGLLSNERSANGIDLIQLFMAVNGGNSGGPVFDKNGVLHGIVVSKLLGISTEGICFAIPSYKIAEYLNLSLN